MSWKDVKEQLNQAKTPAERRAAADALVRQIPAEEQNKRLVTMRNGGINVVKLGDLPAAMENPDIYERVKKILAK